MIALISHGNEVNDLPKIYSTGTYVEITDWETLDNTLLAISVTGIRRVVIHSTASGDNGLMTAQTKNFNEPVAYEYKSELEDTYSDLVGTLQQLSNHPYVSKKYSAIDYSSAIDVCYRLSELLPVSNPLKQDLLETVDINLYIEKLETVIKSLGG